MRQKEGNKKYNWKWLAGILLLAALVMGIRLFLVESLHLSTDSMETSLHQGDFVLLDKTPFGKHPKRNAIQVFTSPLRKIRFIRLFRQSLHCLAWRYHTGNKYGVSDKWKRISSFSPGTSLLFYG